MKVPFRRTSSAPQSGLAQAAGDPPAAGTAPDGTAIGQPTAVMPVAQPPGDPAADVSAGVPAGTPAAEQLDPPPPPQAAVRAGFQTRGRLRRRLLYLRRARELGMRDLGGLVFELHRFGRRNDAIVGAKLNALSVIDRELRELEQLLGERRDFTELHEAGVASCERCGALHGSDAKFCPACGTPVRSGLAPARPEAPSPPPAPVAPPVPAPAPALQSGPAVPLWHTPLAAGNSENGPPPPPAEPVPATPGGPEGGAAATTADPAAGDDTQAGNDLAGA